MANNYSSMISESIESVYRTGIATKILQHMDRIRNVSDLGQARRWVMELLQNARDTAFDGQRVKVQVILEKDKIEFRHNGKPFRIKDILSIVNQVSSKEPDEKTVGQFGTGFMTTYQLSEIVEIRSVLKDEGLPYRPFSVRLDRRGKDKEEILNSILRSMEDLKRADDAEEIRNFDKSAFNTSFIYHLEGEYHYRIAKTGMDDLKESILYVLLFSEQIGSVELEYHADGAVRHICFERGRDEPFTDLIRWYDPSVLYHHSAWRTGGTVRRLEIRETAGDGKDVRCVSHFVVYCEEDGLTLAACMDAEQGFLEIPGLVPRVFVDFPLIGAEAFPFPVVLNSRKFKPNESRSGITLVDNENSRDAVVNKELMRRAVLLYGHFLHALTESGCKGLEHVIAMPAFREDKEISERWVRSNVYDALYRIVSNEPMIETASGFACLAEGDVYLAAGDTPEETDGIKQLLGALKRHRTPIGQDGWLQAFAGYEQHASKVLAIGDLFDRAQKMLVDFLEEEKMSAIKWCRMLYQLGMRNQAMATSISAGEKAIFPNQDTQDWAQRKLFQRNELYKAADIPEILKDVSEALDKIPLSGAIGIRKKLLHAEFMDMEIPQMQEYPVMELYHSIARRSNEDVVKSVRYADTALCRESLHFAWSRLISCCPDKELYELAKNSWDSAMPDYEPIGPDIGTYLWKSAYVGVLHEITEKIESLGTLQNVRNAFAKIDGDAFYKWLNAFLRKATESISGFKGAVFPDQNGRLCRLEFLKKDETEHEELKEIAQVFVGLDAECAFYEKLLDKKVKEGNLYLLYGCKDKDIAMKIGAVIAELLSQKSLSEAELAYQEGATMLLAWIQEHSEAERLFPAFWKEEDQMKLLTPKAAALLRKKANMCEKMLKELGAESMEEALEKLSAMSRADKRSGGFDPENDVFYDAGLLDDCAEDEREEMLRAIGKGGELYAYQRIKEFIMAKGWRMAEESETQARFEHPENAGGSITVCYPDALVTDGHHAQAGYDIVVTIKAQGVEDSYYMEVKTHTGTSKVRNRLYVSNEQMKLAAKERGKYYILNVLFDHRAMQGTHVEPFSDPVARIADGTLRNEDNKYVLRIARACF